MNRKMAQRIIVFMALVGIISVFLVIVQNINTGPRELYKPSSDEVTQKVRDGLAAQEAAKPPPQGASPNGHWHDGEWHNAPHTTPMSTEEPSVEPHVHTWSELSLEERKQLVEIFYRERGLKPPPEGYEYRWTSSDVPMLDDNGEPILHPIGEPIVEVETGIGFAPTPAQYQRYKALQVQYSQHMQAGNIAEAQQIAADIALLEKEAEGEIPIIRVFLKSSGLSDEQVKEKIRQAADNVRRSAYEAHNLGYLLD